MVLTEGPLGTPANREDRASVRIERRCKPAVDQAMSSVRIRAFRPRAPVFVVGLIEDIDTLPSKTFDCANVAVASRLFCANQQVQFVKPWDHAEPRGIPGLDTTGRNMVAEAPARRCHGHRANTTQQIATKSIEIDRCG